MVAITLRGDCKKAEGDSQKVAGSGKEKGAKTKKAVGRVRAGCLLLTAYCLLLFPVLELVVKHRVAARERNLPTAYEEELDVRARLKQVAVGDDEVGELALLD
jgi:hypothetical protein